MPDTYVQVAPDSTGKKIRNLQVSALQSDGTVATVLLQVVALSDENGNPLRVLDGRDLDQQALDELRAIRMGIQMLVEWINPLSGVVRTTPLVAGAWLPQATVEDHDLIDIARDLRADEDS